MRISTTEFQLRAMASMLDQQSKLSKTQSQVASGKRITTPADDPVGSAALLGLQQSKALVQRYKLNADAANARLSLEESALTEVSDRLQRVRELAVRANNGSVGDDARQAIAQEVRQIRDGLLGLANSRDQNGDYLFSGHQGNVRPFSVAATGQVIYSGDDGQRYLQVGSARQVADSDPGSQVFMTVRNGNGRFLAQDVPGNAGSGIIDMGTVVDAAAYTEHDYRIDFSEPSPNQTAYTVTDTTSGTVVAGPSAYTDGGDISFAGIRTLVTGTPAAGDAFTVTPSANESLFANVQNFIAALESGTAANSTPFNNAVNRVLSGVDQAQENVLSVRARIGARMNGIDSEVQNHDNFLLEVDQNISTIQDVDYAEAVSRLNLQMTSLQAAQQAYTRVQGLSLFNYLG